MDLEKSSTPVPGWYADPENLGSERYWDGNEWTGQRRPSQSSTSSTGGASAGSSSNGFAITALVCGIIGVLTFWIFVGLVLGIIAIVFGVLARKRAQNEPSGGAKGMATAGFVLGILAVVGTIIYIILIAAFVNTSLNTLDGFSNEFEFCLENPDAARCN